MKEVVGKPVSTTAKVHNRKLHTDLTTVNDTIIQATRRTKDAMLSLTDLCNSFNELLGTNKRVNNYLEQKSTKELIEELDKQVNSCCVNSSNKIVSKFNKYGTWGHPLLWLDFAMWLSPQFKVACLKLIADKVIDFRIDTIDLHNQMKEVLSTLSLSVGQIIRLQTDINMCAFGAEYNQVKSIRDNKANEDALDRLKTIQNTIIQLVECGMATDYCDIQKYLKNYHRKQWGRELYKKDRVEQKS